METNFYAKIDTINETSYDTYTCSVVTEDNERLTCRIPKEHTFKQNAVYHFEVEPIMFKERQQYMVIFHGRLHHHLCGWLPLIYYQTVHSQALACYKP